MEESRLNWFTRSWQRRTRVVSWGFRLQIQLNLIVHTRNSVLCMWDELNKSILHLNTLTCINSASVIE